MKTIGIFILPAMLAAAASAAPRVENVKLVQEDSGLVKITYDLKDEPGIVLFDVLDGAVSVGETNLTRAVGDVNRRIAAGDGKTIWWTPGPGAEDFDGKELSARVTAYALDAPPDILVLDLTGCANCSFYRSEASLPDGGLSNDIYRKSKLVMKKVHADGVTFLSGKPGSDAARYKPFLATFTYDYYLGIYPVTQAQQLLIDGETHSHFTNGVDAAMRPVDKVNWVDIRYYYGWPDEEGKFRHDNVGDVGFLAVLRRSGLPIDLPTSTEWEYACRAGNASLYGNGTDDAAGLSGIGVFKDNAGGTTHPVGSNDPNDWGFYDMHGNVCEWTLDWFRNTEMPSRDSVVQTDYNGPAAAETYGGAKTLRGGGIGSTAGECASHVTLNRIYSANAATPIGYRVCVRAVIP